ncbi:senescence-associated protein-domain-containing protein [Cokeromyces recurvatus]|uniref:senescence-associated protein-domain-containing protein n=1 Tax=Cokeromyces recurvatus TaxID=90255 RepID=UPI002220E17E|nr:senescence-associated protein-domain-containing protein [Cokeromyces recurvatus]KAI7903730.1 senescence-associated protein-domain-containing protein [Cokeromyces recurvatus]
MTDLPITPTMDQIDPDSLTHICLIDRVSVSSFDNDSLTPLGDGHLVAYISSDPLAKQQVLLLQFYNYFDEMKAAIVLVSRSQAWLQDDRTLIFPRAEGGLWRIDCSASDELAFTELQDVLTFFIKYENRHQMKNTLAMVDPVSCKMTQVVANNVQLDLTESQDILDEEDFITSHENKQGQKLPVYIQETTMNVVIIIETVDPSQVKKVKLLYQSGDAMVTGSDWIAHAIVLAGQALAKGITSGSKIIEKKIEPAKTPVRLNDQEKRILEIVYNTTSTATQMTANLVDKAVSTALSGINSIVYQEQIEETNKEPIQNASRHFGMSALQAAVKIIGGVASAASVVLTSSRDSLVQMIHKKYGDVGYMAGKTLGTGKNIAEMLIYFDARGISRRVILSGVNDLRKKSQENKEVVFENEEWIEDKKTKESKEDTATINKTVSI